MQLSVQSDIKEVTRYLNRVERKQVPFAVARALTWTAKDAQKAIQANMPKQLDRPTPFTLKGIAIKPASKRDTNPFSRVYIKPFQYNYLRWQIDGGVRTPQKRAIPVPVGLRLNRYGNMTRNAVARELAKPDTFSGTINGVSGVWKRYKNRSRHPKLLIAWKTQASYRPRFYFYRTAEKIGRAKFPSNMERSMQLALASAR